MTDKPEQADVLPCPLCGQAEAKALERAAQVCREIETLHGPTALQCADAILALKPPTTVVRYWLCCGSTNYPHNESSCYEAQAGRPERVRYGTAQEHSEWDKSANRAAQSAPVEGDKDCVCKGNWRALVKENEHLLEKWFIDSQGEEFKFFGIIHSADDFYYGMWNKNNTRLLSCVGSIEDHGFTPSKQGEEG